MTIHVVVGPPCSGKSTFVETNAPAGTPRWDFDHVASTVAGTETDHDIPQPVRQIVLAMRRGLMGYVLDAETDVEDLWLIHASPSPTTIQALAAQGAEFHLLDPGMEECLARAQRENRPDFTAEAIRAWYDNPPEIPDEKEGPMKTNVKAFQVKADELTDAGQFTGYASVFDTVDSYGDVVRKGAFAETLQEWKDGGRTLPVLYGHDFRDPFSNIGGVTAAEEDDHGLKITAQLDVEDNPKAKQVHRLLKEGRLAEMSFAYFVREAAWATEDEEEVFELRNLKLLEVSVVPIGANPDTTIVDVKAARDVLSTAVKQADDEDRAVLSAALKALEVDDVKDNNDDGGDVTPPKKKTAPGRVNALRASLALLQEGHL